MSGETESQESGWTTDTLHYHLSRRLDDLEKMLNERHMAQKDGVNKALDSMDKRFESVNEFRATLSDQQKNFLARQEYDAAHDNLVERVNELSSRIDRSEGKGAGYAALYGWIVAGVTVLIMAIAFFNTSTGK